MDCEKVKILSIAHILGDLDPSSEQYCQLESHLVCCPICREEYKRSKWTIGFIEKHKAIFAEALRTREKRKAVEQEEIERSWKHIESRLDELEAQQSQEKHTGLRRIFVRVSAVAVCLIIGILTLIVFSNYSKPQTLPQYSCSQQVVSVPKPSVKVEIVRPSGNIAIATNQKIITDNELKTLLINGNHHLKMDTNTILAIEPLVKNSNIGCLVKLASGQVYAHVQHDGNPFAVDTAHGQAVIMGTTFGVKATEDNTTLMVSEGTVQFESENGVVKVAAGQTSEIVGQSAPSIPLSCNTAELTAWATGYKPGDVAAPIESATDTYDVTELVLFTVRDTSNLESANYDEWIEEYRDWFKQEYPWLFQLKNALTKEDIKVDYPCLLIQSGDIWQFVFPESTPQQISSLKAESLMNVSSHYGYNDEWLFIAVPAAKYLSVENSAAKDQFFGLEAFEQWHKCIEKARWNFAEVDSDKLLYSFHASVYIARTRALAWLCVQNGMFESKTQDKTKLLSLLQAQIKFAHSSLQTTIELITTNKKPCSAEYLHCIGAMLENIEGLQTSQKKIYDNLQIVGKGGVDDINPF